MKMKMPDRVRKWLVVPPVLLGVGIFVWLMFNDRQPQKRPTREIARVLHVIEAPSVKVVPRVLGYGTAKPLQVWRAVVEVEGRVVEVHPELKPGAFLRADEVVLKIDPREYELTVSQLESEIAQVEAEQIELATQENNDRASLEIEQASLRLAKEDLDRVGELIERGASTPKEQRNEERTYLTQKQKVQALENALDLIPNQLAILKASLAVSQARLAQARLDLKKTVIQAPFNCRLGEVQIENGQYLKQDEVLFEADGTAVTEVDAQVAMDRIRNLIPVEARRQLDGIPNLSKLREVFGVQAVVRLRVGEFSAEWPARFVRIREQIDPITRTVAVVVAVDRPYELTIPGKRPPLVKGIFCEVELRGKAMAGHIVIPRTAIHNGHVYIVDTENHLRQRLVNVLFEQSDFLCLESGLEAGDRVVISDLSPAIEGMLVDPVDDQALRDTLIGQAQARTDVR